MDQLLLYLPVLGAAGTVAAGIAAAADTLGVAGAVVAATHGAGAPAVAQQRLAQQQPLVHHFERQPSLFSGYIRIRKKGIKDYKQ